MRLACVLLACALGGCGGDAQPSSNDLSTPRDLTVGGSDLTVGGSDLASGFTLKIEDYLSWCVVGVNGGNEIATAVQTLTVPKGTVVHLSADRENSTFVWGYWVGTAGDTSAAHDKSMSTTVTVNADTTVQACCPFAVSSTTPCPAP